MSYSEQQHYFVTGLKKLAESLGRVPTSADVKAEWPHAKINLLFGSHDGFLRAAGLLEAEVEGPRPREPRIFFVDLELKPIVAHVWGLFDQNIGLDQILEDWSILSWSGKFHGEEEVFYYDVSEQEDLTDDKAIVTALWHKINECDIIVTQNGIKFDEKKMNTKFEQYGLGPPSPYRHIDVLRIKKRHFGLTSNKLAYTTEFFNVVYKKLSHGKFPGFSLWKECLKRNPEAWAEMKEYNIHDVLSLEEEWARIRKWDKTINFSVYTQQSFSCIRCGSQNLEEANYSYSNNGAVKAWRCLDCKGISTERQNDLTTKKRMSLLKP